MATKTTQMWVKLLIDNKDNKVVFAEAGKDFVDFLFHILTLPVSKVIWLLSGKDMVGCISNLYRSIENLNECYVQPNQTKEAFLKDLSLNYAPVRSALYICGCNFYSDDDDIPTCVYYSDDTSSKCPDCNEKMTTKINYVSPKAAPAGGNARGGGGFVKDVVTYMVMDDLVVTPMSTISSIALLNKFNVRDVGVLEERVVNFDMAHEGWKLLKASFEGKAALTSVFLAT